MTLEGVPICFTRSAGLDEDGFRILLFGKPHCLVAGHLEPRSSPEMLVGNRVAADLAAFFACLSDVLRHSCSELWYLEDELAKIRERKAA